MLQTWNRWLWISNSNFALFFTLLVFTHIIYLIFFRGFKAKFSSGLIPMSAALVALTCLPSFETPNMLLKLASMEIIIIWLYLISNLMERFLNQEIMLAGWKEKLNFGAMVSATTLSLLLFVEIEPTLYGFIILQALIAAILMAIYLVISLQWLSSVFKKKGNFPTDGKIFFVTISPLLLMMLVNEILLTDIPILLYQAVIIYAFIFYVIGLYVVCHYLFVVRRSYCLVCWSNLNVLIYAASAALGIAILNTRSFSELFVIILWYWTLLMFIGVTTIELCRMVLRIRKKGIIHGVLIYRTDQWARVFSLAMLYAFQSAYHLPHPISDYSYYLNSLGFYVVLLIFFIEMVLLFAHVIYQRFFYSLRPNRLTHGNH